MAPDSTALEVTLSDGTILQVKRDGYSRSINHLEPSDAIKAKLAPHITLFGDQTLNETEIIEQLILPCIQIFGVNDRTPQFIRDETVSLTFNSPTGSDEVQLFGGSITSLKRT